MKYRPAIYNRIFFCLVLSPALIAFVYYIAIPTHYAWGQARVLSDALTNARSITLVEYQYEYALGRDIVFSRVPASAQQVADLRTATGSWYAPIPRRSSKCFMPHHRVEIVRADGSRLHFEVCFRCKNFRLGESGGMMPASWNDRLAAFFTSVGMPPRADYSALVRGHPEYLQIEEAFRERDRQIDEQVKAERK